MPLQHHKQRHQSLAARQQKRKERQCLSPSPDDKVWSRELRHHADIIDRQAEVGLAFVPAMKPPPEDSVSVLPLDRLQRAIALSAASGPHNLMCSRVHRRRTAAGPRPLGQSWPSRSAASSS